MSTLASCSRTSAVLAMLALLPGAVSAQQKLLTIDDIYDPAKRITFSAAPPLLTWIDATHYATARTAGEHGVDWMRVDAGSGNAAPLFDAARMQTAFARLPGVPADEARKVPHSSDLIFNPKYTAALVTFAADLYVYTFDTDRAVRLTYAAGDEELPSF